MLKILQKGLFLPGGESFANSYKNVRCHIYILLKGQKRGGKKAA
jgi:hypothetical protein